MSEEFCKHGTHESQHCGDCTMDDLRLLAKLREENLKLRKRLENAIWFQEAATNFISHFEDCNALTDEGFNADNDPCECGLDRFAHDNYISRTLSRKALEVKK